MVTTRVPLVPQVLWLLNHSQMFFKIGVLKSFVTFTEKHTSVVVSFNKVAGLHAYNFIKKDTPTPYF